MDVAGLSHERGGSPVVAQRSSGARDRRGRRTHGSMAPLTTNRPSGDVDRSAAAPDTADQLQAEYFLRLLNQNRRLVDHRIDGYHKAIAVSEANGDAEGACGLRRMARIEEQDRKTLDGLIENLHRRFPSRAAGEVAAAPRKARLAVR